MTSYPHVLYFLKRISKFIFFFNRNETFLLNMFNAFSFDSLHGQASDHLTFFKCHLCKMPDWPTLPIGRKQQFLSLCHRTSTNSQAVKTHLCLHLSHTIKTVKIKPLSNKIFSFLEISKDFCIY